MQQRIALNLKKEQIAAKSTGYQRIIKRRLIREKKVAINCYLNIISRNVSPYLRSKVMHTKRQFERIRLNNKGLVYHNDDELEIEVIDISECGIGIQFKKKLNVHIGDRFRFAFISELENKQKTVLGECAIVRIEENEKGTFAGCTIEQKDNDRLNAFVSEKKTELFIKNGFNLGYLIGVWD